MGLAATKAPRSLPTPPQASAVSLLPCTASSTALATRAPSSPSPPPPRLSSTSASAPTAAPATPPLASASATRATATTTATTRTCSLCKGSVHALLQNAPLLLLTRQRSLNKKKTPQ